MVFHADVCTGFGVVISFISTNKKKYSIQTGYSIKENKTWVSH